MAEQKIAHLRRALGEQVSAYVSREYGEVAGDDSVAAAAKAMQRVGSTEALAVEDGAPIGIVTERDILYRVVAVGSAPASVRVRDVMSSPVETIEETSRVRVAIARMAKLGVRRLGVTRNGRVTGIVTQKALVLGNVLQTTPLPELAAPTAFACPYCGAMLKTGEELAKHIDQVHLGRGLLEREPGSDSTHRPPGRR